MKKKSKKRSWSNSAPKTLEERAELYRRCGPTAFLAPDSHDPGQSAYPIMAKGTKACAFDCRGLRAAFARARQYRDARVAEKAKRVAYSLSCPWARA